MGGGGGGGWGTEWTVGLKFVSQMTISRYRGKIRTLYLFFAFVLPRTNLLESKTLFSDFKIAVAHECESKNSLPPGITIRD